MDGHTTVSAGGAGMIYAFGIVYAALLFADVLLTTALIGAGHGHRYPIANLFYVHAYATFGVMAQKAIVGACGIWLVLHFGHWWVMAAILLLQALIVCASPACCAALASWSGRPPVAPPTARILHTATDLP